MPTHSDRLRPGEIVRIRAERWRVQRWMPYQDAAAIDVAGCDRTNRARDARFLIPFEPIQRLPLARVPKRISRAKWRCIARGVLADATPEWRSLRAAAGARLDIVPFQLEPVLAVTSGRACRLLIADDVGLGKTIQAGLIVAELLAREPDAHVLVVCPAALREQWRLELSDRFGLPAMVLDAAGMARAADWHGPAANPWASSQHLIVTSIDYVKRPEVARALEPLLWDAVVFDEAHGLAGMSDRRLAAGLLGARARRVVMLTATPHSGDDEAYRRMCGIGELDGDAPLLVFRRSRADAGIAAHRRTSMLSVRPSTAEAAMHDALLKYAQRVWAAGAEPGARLAMAVLMRRACSSATSLVRSLERRLSLLTGRAAPGGQPPLPFLDIGADDDEPDSVLAADGLHDRDEERAALERLLALARRASQSESKVAALVRLLGRVREPAIVFTEYRDTLAHLGRATRDAVQLHGGMPLKERRAAARAFTDGGAPLLLATDAASEGLNLHQRCRLVINLELPWTPVRLEQRIGRVDRIGQRRRVHAIHFVARGTREQSVVARLAARADRARASLEQVAEAVIETGTLGEEQRPIETIPAGAIQANLRLQAGIEAARLVRARRLGERRAAIPESRPVFSTVRRRRRAPPQRVWVWSATLVDGTHRLLWESVIAAAACPPVEGEPAGLAVQQALARVGTLGLEMAPCIDLLAGRERALKSTLRQHHARLSAGLAQRGLFDHRAERIAQAQAVVLDEALARADARLSELEAWSRPSLDECRLLFAVTLG